MGFTKPDLPDIADPDEFLRRPLMERMRVLGADWAEQGFGSPKLIHTIYLVKLTVFFVIGGLSIAMVTSGLPAFWHVSRVVEPADRVPEGHPVDGAARGHRRRRVMGPARRQGQADDRRHPVLGPARHHPATTLEVGARHRR